MPIPPKKLKLFQAQQKQGKFLGKKPPKDDEEEQGSGGPPGKKGFPPPKPPKGEQPPKPPKGEQPPKGGKPNPGAEKKGRKLAAFVKQGKKHAPPEPDEEPKGEEPEGDEGGDRHMNEDEAKEAFTKGMNEVENGPDGKLQSVMAGYDGSGETPEGFDDGVWEVAKEITNPDSLDADDPWLVCAHVYKHLGGKVPGADEDGAMPNEAEKDDDADDEGGSEGEE